MKKNMQWSRKWRRNNIGTSKLRI